MKLQLATQSDIPQIKEVYKGIVDKMFADGIEMWNDDYPESALTLDVNEGELYLLKEGCELLGAFALNPIALGEKHVKWQKDNAKVTYLKRMAVNATVQSKGIARLLIQYAKDEARSKGYEYLRLFVVDYNEPAINLYRSENFIQAEGVYEDNLSDELRFIELGLEIKLLID